MARARNIKPGFFTNDALGDLNPLARILFIGIWCHADRAGRLLDRPKKLKVEVLPYDDCDPNRLLQDLHGAGMVHRYEVAGIKYIQCVNFTKHQNPHIKEPESTIPAPDLSGAKTADSLILIPDSLNPSTTLSGKPDVSPPESKKLNGKKAEAIEVLDFLNAQTGKAYRPVDANLEMIVARLREGYTVADIRKVIVRKADQWKDDEKMALYLRPATLFNKTKLAQYSGELVVPQ